jgi:hypothetical protein
MRRARVRDAPEGAFAPSVEEMSLEQEHSWKRHLAPWPVIAKKLPILPRQRASTARERRNLRRGVATV